MKLFVLYTIEFPDYDEYGGFVIRAKNEQVAREMAAKICGKYSNGHVFLDYTASTCEVITSRGKEETILSSFRAG